MRFDRLALRVSHPTWRDKFSNFALWDRDTCVYFARITGARTARSYFITGARDGERERDVQINLLHDRLFIAFTRIHTSKTVTMRSQQIARDHGQFSFLSGVVGGKNVLSLCLFTSARVSYSVKTADVTYSPILACIKQSLLAQARVPARIPHSLPP